MSNLDAIAEKLEEAMGRLEMAVSDRLSGETSGSEMGQMIENPEAEETVAALEDLQVKYGQLAQENTLLKQDAAGLAQRLTSALHRLDTVLAGSEEQA